MARPSVPGAEQFVPDGAGPEGLEDAVQECRGCELYRDATQAVFGRIGLRPADRRHGAGMTLEALLAGRGILTGMQRSDRAPVASDSGGSGPRGGVTWRDSRK
jgi:hypothetical protein